MKNLLLIPLIAVLAGCTLVRPLKPGTARIQSGVGTNGVRSFVSEMKQPENPAQSAAQNYERTTLSELPLPEGTEVVERTVSPENGITTERIIRTLTPTVQKTQVTERAG